MMKNSIILAFYLLVASVYYLFNDAVRILIFGVSFGISLYMGVKSKNGFPFIKVPKTFYLVAVGIFGYTVLVQLINNTLTPFVVYYLSSPLIAYFIYTNHFNTKILTLPFYAFASYILSYFFLHRNLFGVLNNVSENYLSIILIMNLITIYVVKFRQKEVISILPAFIGFFLSILAVGRSGIITTLFVLLLVLWFNWKGLPRFKKIFSIAIFLAPLILLVFLKWDLINTIFNNMEVFEKFSNSGVASPSRDIIKRAYFSNINSVTFFTGYNYAENYWFQHYGLNPHNSYIRLHYFSGFAFFIIMPILFISLIKLIKKNLFFSGLLLAVLLRSYTDSVLFLTLFDYVPVLLIMTAFLNNKTKYIK
jgi:hypothetical protein